MIFWKILEVVMIFFQIFRKKSSRPRKFFKKLSKVTQVRFSNSLTTYFGCRTFWRLFLNLSSFPWILKEKKNFSSKSLMNSCGKFFFSFENRKITTATPKSVLFKICSQRLRHMIVFSFLVQQFTSIRHLGEQLFVRKFRDNIHYT